MPRAKKSIDLTISRARWLNGTGSQQSALLRASDQKMCCLGFLARKMGVSVRVIKDKQAPSSLTHTDLPKNAQPFVDLLTEEQNGEGWYNDKAITGNLMRLNDFPFLQEVRLFSDESKLEPVDTVTLRSNEDREREIVKQFAKIDVNCTFED